MKILIADDVRGWRDYHRTVMSGLYPDAEIDTADSARDGYDKVIENNELPYDIILTDLQMETDFEPLYAGEWFIERIKETKNYYKTRIIIISASYNIRMIAQKYGVDCISKADARNYPDLYKKYFGKKSE